jgi:UDP-N-acetylmuramoyl-L-alanyl-D-glutamate--2,6-diaminopimelate ligase
MVLNQSKSYAYDSRKIQPGDGFICLPKGDAYINDALARGATEVVRLDRLGFAQESHRYYGDPTKQVCLIGVTGTNGKTSVAHFTAQLLRQSGYSVLVIGTMTSALTTPESWDIAKQIRHHVDNGGTHVVMEVSSHGIDQGRVLECAFDVKCLTNITHDHLDYHKTFDAYKATKMHFMIDYPGVAIYADEVPLLAENLPQLMGAFHKKNVATAMAICRILGINATTLKAVLPKLTAPAGRFQPVILGQPFHIIVDFAHTPDALAVVLTDALALVNGHRERVRVVFGCGGDRDTRKRSEMGRIAGEYADHVYLTSDNPRSESPEAIIAAIQTGVSRPGVQAITDRHSAIARVIADANPRDIVVIAGKGHEAYQVMRWYRYQSDDVAIATYEVIRQNRYHTSVTWVMDDLKTPADVVFITKNKSQALPYAPIPYCQVKPTPSQGRVRDYLAKIKGPKLCILESANRFSMMGWLHYVLGRLGSVTVVDGMTLPTVPHQLAQMMLIEQTVNPVIIRLDPNHPGFLSQWVSVIQPEHIIVGDNYHANGYVAPSVVTVLKNKVTMRDYACPLWIHDRMADINDALGDYAYLRCVKAPHWVDYCVRLAQQLMVELDKYHSPLSDMFYEYSMTQRWLQKVQWSDGSVTAYAALGSSDEWAMHQYVDYMNHVSATVYHHIATSEGDRWARYLRQWCRSTDRIQVYDPPTVTAFANTVQSRPDALHVIWCQHFSDMNTWTT